MLGDVLLLGLGLAALIGGGTALVDGASGMAIRMGVAPVLVGLTVVAFGTSTPELVVNIVAALRGNTEIGFGNVVGSNIANIGLLLGVAAVIAPLAIHRTLVVREIPMLVLASAAALVLGGGRILGESAPGFGRGDGFMLLLLFAVFLYYTIGDAVRQRADPILLHGSPPEVNGSTGTVGNLRIAALIVGGLAALVLGGELAVRGAVGVATALGLSQTIVGLTVVAVGTSLPELATTLTAARNGNGDIAIGNIVGSNIYNLLFVWGLSVAIEPSVMPVGGSGDLIVMTAMSLVLLPMAITQHRLGRIEGVFMVAGYMCYIGWLAVR